MKKVFEDTVWENSLKLARFVHNGQKRKDGTDYIYHPLRVAEIVDDLFINTSQIDHSLFWMVRSIAVLHDVIENGVKIDEEDFFVASLPSFFYNSVLLLSRRGKNYFKYIKKIVDSNNTYAKVVKIADLVHNLSDLEDGSMKDKYRFALIMLLENTKIKINSETYSEIFYK